MPGHFFLIRFSSRWVPLEKKPDVSAELIRESDVCRWEIRHDADGRRAMGGELIRVSIISPSPCVVTVNATCPSSDCPVIVR